MSIYPQTVIDAQITKLENDFEPLALGDLSLLTLHQKHTQFQQSIATLRAQQHCLGTEIAAFEKQIEPLPDEIAKYEQDPTIQALRTAEQEKVALAQKIESLTWIQIHVDSSKKLTETEQQTLVAESITPETLDQTLVTLRKQEDLMRSNGIWVIHRALFASAKQSKAQKALAAITKQLEEKRVALKRCEAALEQALTEQSSNLVAMDRHISLQYAAESELRQLWIELHILRMGATADAAQHAMHQHDLKALDAKYQVVSKILPNFTQFLKDKITELKTYAKQRKPSWIRRVLETLFHLVERSKKVDLAQKAQSQIEKDIATLETYVVDNQEQPITAVQQKLGAMICELGQEIAENQTLTRVHKGQFRFSVGQLHAYLQSCQRQIDSTQTDYKQAATAYNEALQQHNRYNPDAHYSGPKLETKN